MRIAGVNIPDDKKIEFALPYLYGIGRVNVAKVLSAAKVAGDKRARELTSDEIGRIQAELDRNYRVEGELRQLVRQNVQRLKELKTYRGSRHAHNLPSRGQRTRTNSRTVRGNIRKTAGSGKRKVELK